MKLKRYREKVGEHGEIRIPARYLQSMGLDTGKEVDLSLREKGLFIEPVEEAIAKDAASSRDPVKELTGSLELDPELVDAIVEADYQPEQA